MEMMDRKVYPVSQVNRYVKAILAQDRILSGLWVSGEISNYKHHSSGHRYFTIKDAGGQVSAVMFASNAGMLSFRPVEGMRILAYGQISLYEKTGQYQMYVQAMEQDGEGALYQAYLRQKERFEQEGLFDASHKKPVPVMATTIGIITSPTGAAVRDMIQTARRRYPGVRILFCPVLVQGPDAAASIAGAIRRMNEDGRAQVLLVGRGGGSIEDLWAFNEEETVRAIYASSIPVISAVGHETDFTLADFTADLRAATPTAAAELAVPDALELKKSVARLSEQMSMQMHHKLEQGRKEVAYYMDQTASRMIRLHINGLRQQVDMETQSMMNLLRGRMEQYKVQIRSLQGELQLMDPYLPLEKGYSILSDQNGIIRSVLALEPGKEVEARLKDGKAILVTQKRESRS